MKKRDEDILSSTFVDLQSDSGFKAAFADPENERVLVSLLNLILPESWKIAKIDAYSDREIGGFTPYSKSARLDLSCKTESGTRFIVEMQQKVDDVFFDRCIWYASTLYGSDMMPGDDYSKLRPVFIVSFLSGKYPHKDESLWKDNDVISCYQMTEMRTGEVARETIMLIFVELGRFRKTNLGQMSELEQVYYEFKNLHSMKDIPDGLRPGLALDLADVSRIAAFNPDKKRKYLADMITERDFWQIKKILYNEGKEEGREEGMKKGMAAGKMETAMKMLSLGLPISIISEVTGFSADEIAKMDRAK